MARGHLLETGHMLAASPQQIGRAFGSLFILFIQGKWSSDFSAISPLSLRPCLPLGNNTHPRIHPSVPGTSDVGSARPAGAGQAVRETWSASRSWPGLLNTSGCMCAAFWLMTSAIPAAASSRASKHASAMRRARQVGLDNICNIINARARATTIESAIGHSDVAHANTGNTEDISRNCISPPSRAGWPQRLARAEGFRIPSRRWRPATRARDQYWQTTANISREASASAVGTFREKLLATAGLRMLADRQQLSSSGGPIFTRMPSVQASRPSCLF